MVWLSPQIGDERFMRIFLAFWSLLWVVGMPLLLGYLRRRGRKDPLYAQHLGERFGRYSQTMSGTVWIHAVSLGEMRSVAPLVRALRARGEKIVLTCVTPTGRREAQSRFAEDIARGDLAVVWLPMELAFCFRGFFRAFRPKLGLVVEVEIWPRMVQSARDHGVKLLMCNALYPARAMVKDRGFPLRPAVMRRFFGAMVKSDIHAQRFASVGVSNIHVTGELRFDQPPSAALRADGIAAGQGREAILFGPFPEAEEWLALDTLVQLSAQENPPLMIVVPRAPERFIPLAEAMAARGIPFALRSQVFDEQRRALAPLPAVLLGDSMGEMPFYIAMADRVVVGGGFSEKGSHNIIEPLALEKPVLVGPNIANGEYPILEAIEAGLCKQVMPQDLAEALGPKGWTGPSPAQIQDFLAAHGGATARSMAVIEPLLADKDNQ